MIPYIPENSQEMLRMISIAIRSVYASVFFQTSKAYLEATSNAIDEEKMGIILQEVCGSTNGNRFYPTLSGVSRSINFYPIEPEQADDGIAMIAYGLGKFLMEGRGGLRFSPKFPKNVLQLSSPEMVLRNTQKEFYAINLDPDSFVPSVDDGMNLLRQKFGEAEKDPSFRFAASTFDLENQMVRDGVMGKGKRVVRFSPVVNIIKNRVPGILKEILSVGQKSMSNPVEIEFAVNMDVPPDSPAQFNILQIRPIVLSEQSISFSLDDVSQEDSIVYSESVLGNGSFLGLKDLVYVDPAKFRSSESKQIALIVDEINYKMLKENRIYILRLN